MDVSQGAGFESREKIFCASLDHTVGFRRLLWDHSHPTKCVGWLHDAPILFIDANVETQWFLHFDTPSRGNYLYKVVVRLKKVGFYWVKALAVRGAKKNFCVSLDHTVCFRRLLWDRAHPTKCAGWSHDAPIISYLRKRGNTVIFAFWYSFKSQLLP